MKKNCTSLQEKWARWQCSLWCSLEQGNYYPNFFFDIPKGDKSLFPIHINVLVAFSMSSTLIIPLHICVYPFTHKKLLLLSIWYILHPLKYICFLNATTYNLTFLPIILNLCPKLNFSTFQTNEMINFYVIIKVKTCV